MAAQQSWLLAIFAATSLPAHAQAPRVPVSIYAGELNCSTATIMNLPRGDNFLSVRAGPSAREDELARLNNGDAVFACVRSGNWFGIVFEHPGSVSGCDIARARAVTENYRGPCRSGWVYHLYIGGYADWISP